MESSQWEGVGERPIKGPGSNEVEEEARRPVGRKISEVYERPLHKDGWMEELEVRGKDK